MTILLPLLLLALVGCGESQQRQRIAERQDRLDSLFAAGRVSRDSAFALIEHSQQIILSALDRADRLAADSATLVLCDAAYDAMGARVDSLMADSARHAARCASFPIKSETSKPDTCRWVYNWRVIPESTKVYKDQELLFSGPTIWVRDSIWHCPTKEQSK